MKYLIFTFLISLSLLTKAQSKNLQTLLDLKITSVEKMRKTLENTTFLVYKNDVLKDSILLDKGKFKLKLDTGFVYKVVIKKKDYVTKYVILNTQEAPEKAKKFTKLKIDIGLFHKKENLNVEFLKAEPIGYARYDFITEKMAWDEAYLDLMKSKIIRATLDYAKSKETL